MAESIFKNEEGEEEIRAKLKDLEAQIAANNPRNIAGMREKELRALTRQNFFGDGHHGDILLDGTTDFNDFSSRSGTTYTLTSDVYSDNLDIKSGVIVLTNGYRIFCKSDLSNRGDIKANGGDGGAGGDAVTTTGGAAGAAGTAAHGVGSLPASVSGKAGALGANSGLTDHNNGATGDSRNPSMGVAGVAGGGAYDGEPVSSPGGGGGAGVATLGYNLPFTYVFAAFLIETNPSASALLGTAGSGSGAGGGAGDAGDGSGGGGGGSGAPGGIIVIFANRIINEGSIQANGGNGGVGGVASSGGDDDGASGGGGGGGSGGVIVLVYGVRSGSGSEAVTGGNGGAGGVANGWFAGLAGSTGNAGTLYEIELG